MASPVLHDIVLRKEIFLNTENYRTKSSDQRRVNGVGYRSLVLSMTMKYSQAVLARFSKLWFMSPR